MKRKKIDDVSDDGGGLEAKSDSKSPPSRPRDLKRTAKAAEKFRVKIQALGGVVIDPFIRAKNRVRCLCPAGHNCFPRPSAINDGRAMCIKCSKRDPEDSERKFRAAIELLGGVVVDEWTTARTKTTCVCKNGHLCAPFPNNIIAGRGMCTKCANTDSEDAEQRFRDNISKLGGTILGIYTNACSPVSCKCPMDHDCAPIPSNISQGGGMCMRCARKSDEKELKFRNRLLELGATMIGEYIDTTTKVRCLCKNAHECMPMPTSVFQGQGICTRCTGKDQEIAKLNFITRIEQLGGKVIGSYQSSGIRVKCICPNGHECEPLPDYIRRGGGMCGKCVTRVGELKFGALLALAGFKNILTQFRLPQPDNNWKFDFKIDNCLFEFDGDQHFRPVELFGGEEGFKAQRFRDIAKTYAASKHDYRTVRVHYDWIKKPQHEQIQFIKTVMESTDPLIVSDKQKYQWLVDAGFSIIQPTQRNPSEPPTQPVQATNPTQSPNLTNLTQLQPQAKFTLQRQPQPELTLQLQSKSDIEASRPQCDFQTLLDRLNNTESNRKRKARPNHSLNAPKPNTHLNQTSPQTQTQPKPTHFNN